MCPGRHGWGGHPSKRPGSLEVWILCRVHGRPAVLSLGLGPGSEVNRGTSVGGTNLERRGGRRPFLTLGR